MRRKIRYMQSDAKNITGRRIKEVRIQYKMTQEELAVKLQLKGLEWDSSTISKIELGKRSVMDYEIREIAKCLEIDILYLLLETDTPNT